MNLDRYNMLANQFVVVVVFEVGQKLFKQSQTEAKIRMVKNKLKYLPSTARFLTDTLSEAF